MKISLSNSSHKLLKGSLFMIFGSSVANICSYFFQFIMSRRLSVANFGAMNSLFSLMAIISVPSSCIQLIIAKYVSNFNANNDLEKVKLFHKKILEKLAKYGSIILVVLLLTSPWIADFLKITSFIPVFILLLTSFSSFLSPINIGTLQGLQKFLSLGILPSVAGILKLFLGIMLVDLGLRLNGALIAVFLSTLACFLIPFYYLKGVLRSDSRLFDLGIGYKNILTYSFPVFSSSLAMIMLTNIDMIMVKHFFPAEQAGIYASVAVLGRTIYFFPMAIIGAMFPIVSEAYALKKDSFFVLKIALLITTLMSGSGLIVFFIAPDLMLTFLFGQNFSGAAPLLRIFSIAMFFISLINVLVIFYLAIERKHFLAFLFAPCALEIVLISFFHQTLIIVPIILCVLTFAVFAWFFFQTLRPDFRESLKRPADITDFNKTFGPII